MARKLGIGPQKPLLIIVGEAFGEDEEAEGVPFVGKSGTVLNHVLYNLKIPRDQLYITNLINARPREKSNDISDYFFKGQLTEKGKEARECLVAELSNISCPVVVSLGNTALAALTEKEEAGYFSESFGGLEGESDSAASYGPVRGIAKWRGSPLVSPYLPGRIVVPSLHPSFIARGASSAAFLLASDISKAVRYREEAPKTYNIDNKTAKKFEVAEWYLKEALKHSEVAFDIESPGNSLKCFSLCWDEDSACSIPVNGHWNAKERGVLMGLLAELLGAPSGPRIILQNGNFDTSWLQRFENIITNLSRVEDTMYLHHVIYPDIPKSLALLNSLYTDLPYYKGDYEESQHTADFDLLLEYNAKDALATFISWQHLQAHPERAKFEHTYRNLTLANLPAAQHLQRRGFRIDHQELANLRVKAEEDIKPLQQRLDTIANPWFVERQRGFEAMLAGVNREIDAEKSRLALARSVAEVGAKKDLLSSLELKALNKKRADTTKKLESSKSSTLNVGSHLQMTEYFGAVHGLKKASYGEKVLQVLARPAKGREALPEASIILAIRERRKQLEAFLGANLDLDSRYKFSVNIRGTKFGRMSSSKLFWRWGGNAMNLPKSFRRVFIADERHNDCIPFFVNLDQSKAEAYHVAVLANDAALLEECLGKVDGHAVVGSLISGVPYEVVKAEHAVLDETTDTVAIATARNALPAWGCLDQDLRQRTESKWPGMSIRYGGKRRRHAWNYRETPEGYSLRSGDSLADAKAQDSILRRRYFGVVNWWDKVKWEVENKGELVNCHGRVIPFMGLVDANVWKAACAAVPQSGVADVTNAAMREVFSWKDLEVILCNNVYDSLLLQMRLNLKADIESEALRLSLLIQRCKIALERPLVINKTQFTVPVDCKIGVSWGKMNGVKGWSAESLLPELQKLRETK